MKSSEETLIGSDFSLSRVPSFSSSLSSPSPHVHLESSPVGLECSRKYFRVRSIRRRENSGFLHLFPRRARPSPPTGRSFPFRTLMSSESTVSDHEIFRRFVLPPARVMSIAPIPIILSVIYLLYHTTRLSDTRYYKRMQLILILMRYVL